MMGLSSGSTVLIGQAWGARATGKMKAIAATTLMLTMPLIFVFVPMTAMLRGELLPSDLAQACRPPADLITGSLSITVL
jgi:Na+-driven multidrug efflux pump